MYKGDENAQDDVIVYEVTAYYQSAPANSPLIGLSIA